MKNAALLLSALLAVACGPSDKSGGPGGGPGGGGTFGDANDSVRPDGGSGGGGATGGSGVAGDPCEFTPDCMDGLTCYEGICVGAGELRFSMSWMDDTDIDLHVITPAGNEIYYADESYDGGTLDVDDCVSGICAVQDGAHVENVVFEGTPMRGTYEFWAHNYDGEMRAMVKIEAYMGESPTTYEEMLPIAGAAEGAHHTITF